jgi:hypothetical protein
VPCAIKRTEPVGNTEPQDARPTLDRFTVTSSAGSLALAAAMARAVALHKRRPTFHQHFGGVGVTMSSSARRAASSA